MVTGTQAREVALALNAATTRLSGLSRGGTLDTAVQLGTRQNLARSFQEGAALLHMLAPARSAQLGPSYLTRQADALLEQAARIIDGDVVVGQAITQADDAASFLRRRAMHL